MSPLSISTVWTHPNNTFEPAINNFAEDEAVRQAEILMKTFREENPGAERFVATLATSKEPY